jgi:hypothetical protein
MLKSTRPPAIQPTGILEGLKPGAIVFGVFVDITASIVGSLLLVALFGGLQPPQDGASPREAMKALEASPQFLFASLSVGLLCTVWGAYVGAKRAGRLFARHGAWIGIGSALVGLVFYGAGDAQGPRPPFWFDVLGFALLLPAGALGGHWAGLRVGPSAT